MTTNMLQIIVNNLNSPPFNRNISMITFDSMSPEKLLQTLSDVLCWIQGVAEIDIRSETPDETAMRILNTLRILKFPPPRDIDQIQRWRLDILEGNKQAIYPVMEWIFGNVDSLKERVYLANYLTKIDIPPEEQSPELSKLAAVIEQKMDEFKSIHSRIVEIRGDYARADDVRDDLRTMEDEKEQLMRKIERSKTRIGQRPDIEKYLDFAAQHRKEIEQQQELQNQKEEQRNALLLGNQRINRLQRLLNEAERERESDPRKFLEKYRNEAEINRYLVEEKLPNDIASQRTNIESVRKILAMKTVTANDINSLKQKIDQLNKDIMEITMQRDKKDESNEDQLSIYRHQASAVQRKKANLADQLQAVRQQCEYLDDKVAKKKRELGLKTGMDDLVTTVQYKNYLNKMRLKTNLYKKKKLEMDQLTSESNVLQSTKTILINQWSSLKADIQNEGRGIIEDGVNTVAQRPRTAKPKNTDVSELKDMVKALSDELAAKRDLVSQLNEKIQEVSSQHKRENEQYLANQTQINSMKAQMESEQRIANERVNDLETQLKNANERLAKLENDIDIHSSFIESIDEPDQIDAVMSKLERDNQECRLDIDKTRLQLKELSQRADSSEQILMWKSLVQLFEKKIEVQKRKNAGDRPLGDY